MGANAAKLATMVLCVMVVAVHRQCAAQQTQDPSVPSTTVHLEVNVTLLPMVVRDAHGHAVGNLKKEDFAVFEVPISGTSLATVNICLLRA
jgi:hypothetical protein